MKNAFLLTVAFLMLASISNAQITARVPEKAQKLIDAYPDMQLTYSDNAIVFPDGTKIPYDDGKQKDFVTMLDYSDIEDMFSMTYDTVATEPAYLNDCGRSRCEALFKKNVWTFCRRSSKTSCKN